MLPVVRVDHTKYAKRDGISQIAFDSQGSLFCVRTGTTPNVLHVHTFLSGPSASNPEITHLASIIFANPIKSVTWSRGKDKSKRLVVAARTGAVYIWDGESGWLEDGEEAKGGMMEGIGIPARRSSFAGKGSGADTSAGTEFAAHELISSPDGSSVAILDKTQFCMLYETDADETVGERWDGNNEGLSHVMGEDEDWEAGQASFLSSRLGEVLA